MPAAYHWLLEVVHHVANAHALCSMAPGEMNATCIWGRTLDNLSLQAPAKDELASTQRGAIFYVLYTQIL